MQRRGLGKMRHIETQDLWGQQAIKEGRFTVRRVKSEDNTADIGTKPLNRENLERCMIAMGYFCDSCPSERPVVEATTESSNAENYTAARTTLSFASGNARGFAGGGVQMKSRTAR